MARRTAAAFLPIAEPIHDYPRTGGMSITGVVYRGAALGEGQEGRGVPYPFGMLV